MSIFESVIDALNQTQARYVIVGGFAVNLHGYSRFTGDIDVVIDLGPRSAPLLVTAVLNLGFQPRVPVTAEDFGNAEKRQIWIETKGAKVISFIHPDHPVFAVDIFVDPPLEFERLFSTSILVPLTSRSVRIASIQSLIEMKRVAGRNQDLLDIEKLSEIEQTHQRK
jgi:hypothetical protein